MKKNKLGRADFIKKAAIATAGFTLYQEVF